MNTDNPVTTEWTNGMTDHQPDPTPDPNPRDTDAPQEAAPDVAQGLEEVTKLTDEVAHQVGNPKEPSDTPLIADPVAVDAVFDDAQKWADRADEILGDDQSQPSPTQATKQSDPTTDTQDAPADNAESPDAVASESGNSESDATVESSDRSANAVGAASAINDSSPVSDTGTQESEEVVRQKRVENSNNEIIDGELEFTDSELANVPDIGDENDFGNDEPEYSTAASDQPVEASASGKAKGANKLIAAIAARAGGPIVKALEAVDRPFAFLSYRVRKIIGWTALAVALFALALFVYTFYDLSHFPKTGH